MPNYWLFLDFDATGRLLVGTEGGSGEAGFIRQCGAGYTRPGISNAFRGGNIATFNDDAVSLDGGVGEAVLAIFPRQGEPADGPIAAGQAVSFGIKNHPNGLTFHFCLFEAWAAGDEVFLIGVAPGEESQSPADLAILFGVESIVGANGDSEGRLGGCQKLCISPGLIGVALALIPDDALEAQPPERGDHRVVEHPWLDAEHGIVQVLRIKASQGVIGNPSFAGGSANGAVDNADGHAREFGIFQQFDGEVIADGGEVERRFRGGGAPFDVR